MVSAGCYYLVRIRRKKARRSPSAEMPAIGITGGISTGKSTFCECLREILPAAKFFDADAVARHLVDLEEVKEELLAKFGFGIFSRNGDLNRDAVRAISSPPIPCGE